MPIQMSIAPIKAQSYNPNEDSWLSSDYEFTKIEDGNMEYVPEFALEKSIIDFLKIGEVFWCKDYFFIDFHQLFIVLHM